MRGRMVRDLVNEVQAPGRHEISFDGSRLASGLYMYQITSGDFTETRRMTLVK